MENILNPAGQPALLQNRIETTQNAAARTGPPFASIMDGAPDETSGRSSTVVFSAVCVQTVTWSLTDGDFALLKAVTGYTFAIAADGSAAWLDDSGMVPNLAENKLEQFNRLAEAIDKDRKSGKLKGRIHRQYLNYMMLQARLRKNPFDPLVQKLLLEFILGDIAGQGRTA